VSGTGTDTVMGRVGAGAAGTVVVVVAWAGESKVLIRLPRWERRFWETWKSISGLEEINRVTSFAQRVYPDMNFCWLWFCAGMARD